MTAMPPCLPTTRAWRQLTDRHTGVQHQHKKIGRCCYWIGLTYDFVLRRRHATVKLHRIELIASLSPPGGDRVTTPTAESHILRRRNAESDDAIRPKPVDKISDYTISQRLPRSVHHVRERIPPCLEDDGGQLCML